MDAHILDFNYQKDNRITRLFEAIKKGDTILFLGAGASVCGTKRFLSKDLMDLYKAKTSFQFDSNDIVEFIDVMSANPEFSRNDFDSFVDSCLRQLHPTHSHRILASLNWHSIVTTNYDLLVERSFEELKGTVEENKSLKVIRSKKEFYYTASDDEIPYYKLNGCLYDSSKYPFVFSTDDFTKADGYYKTVLKPLRSMSPKINFLAIGYSFSDPFSRKLLQKIDSYDFRERRTLYSIEPNIKEDSIPWFTQNKICLINTTLDGFASSYRTWEESEGRSIKIYQKNYYTTYNNSPLFTVNSKALQRTDGNLIQLNDGYRSKFIKEVDYYKGEEPDFGIIQRNYDVVKSAKLEEVKKNIIGISDNNASKIIPLVFLTGTFGTGKSTFAYRLLKSFIEDKDLQAVAFEILDPSELKAADLKEVFSKTHATKIFLYVNAFEVNSVFKSLIDLRGNLSIDSSPDYQIVILATIRENIFEKWSLNRNHSNTNVLKIDCKLSIDEVTQLVGRLKDCGLINYRDVNERKDWEKKILKEYDGDSYISLLKIVAGNKLLNDLYEAYSKMNEAARVAFEYTSLAYQFKILMPAGILRSLVKMDWDLFKTEVIDVDGKGILIQEEVKNKKLDADLYFRTKHPIISEELINTLFQSSDIKFKKIKEIITHTIEGQKTGRFLINLIKALEVNNYFTKAQINELYDIADKFLSEDPYFLLHFAINLQKRGGQVYLKLAIQKILYAEALSDYRNHFLIHRRGVLNFQLAKMIFESQDPSLDYLVQKYLDEARDLFDIKRILDPCSSYSYYDLIKLEMWCLSNYDLESHIELITRIKIDEFFDIASKTVFDNQEKIRHLHKDYISEYQFMGDEESYVKFIEDQLSEEDDKPYALILLFNHYFSKGNSVKYFELVTQLEGYLFNTEVVKTLFIFYGRNLQFVNLRTKFFNLIKGNEFLEEKDNLRYNYFCYVAECYNFHFAYALKYQQNINSRFHSLNPDFNRYWIDFETGEAQIFEGYLKLNKKGKKILYIPHLSRYFYINRPNNKIEVNKKYDVKLRFYLYGIRAEVVKFKNEIVEATDDMQEQEEMM